MRLLVALAALVVAGCASVPPISPAATQVRVVSADQAKACTFLKLIEYTDHIDAIGKNPTLWRSIGDAQMRNQTAAAGGNAYVLTSDDMSWFWGDFAYKGEAFKCAA